MSDLPTLVARTEILTAAVIALGEGQRDVIEGLQSLRSGVAVLDAKGDLRAAQAEKIAAKVDEGLRALANIEAPVVGHYNAIRLSDETQAANAGKWGTYLTPDKFAAAVKYVAVVVGLLAAGGVGGSNFRGCGGGFTTAQDVADAHEAAAPVAPTPEPTP